MSALFINTTLLNCIIFYTGPVSKPTGLCFIISMRINTINLPNEVHTFSVNIGGAIINDFLEFKDRMC